MGTLQIMEPATTQPSGGDHTGGAATTVVDADGCAPEQLWRLLATPAQWHRWAPHIRRATARDGDDDRPLTAGDVVRISGWGPVWLTAAITRVDPGTRWDFQVDLPLGHRVRAAHLVLDGPAVGLRMTLEGVVGRAAGDALLAAYRPLARLAMRRLVDIARITST